MSSESVTSKKVKDEEIEKNTLLGDEELDKDTPLSDEEISRLIKASRETSFKRKEIKKEMSEAFKKVSLHDIAKKYNKEIFSKKEVDEDIKQKNPPNESLSVEDSNKSQENKKEVENEDTLEASDNLEVEKNQSDEQENKETIATKTFQEEEHLKILEESNKEAFEKGKQEAYAEIKEGSDAAIAKLNSISEKISKTDQLDLTELENIISNKILDLSSELTGKIIKALPTEFLKKIKNFIATLENNDGKIEIFVSENDFKIMEKNKDIKPKLKEMNISHKAELSNGEVILQINGIKIKHKIHGKNL